MNHLITVFCLISINYKLTFTESYVQESIRNGTLESFSDWYYLKLVTDALEDDNNTDPLLNDDFNIGSCRDGELYQQILDNLCTKLSVPPETFSVFSLDTLTPGIISVNMSLVPVLGLALDLVHVHLSEMPVYSPIFYICDNTYTLSLLLHDADYYHQDVNLTPDVKIFTKTILFLTFLTVSITVIIIFMFLVMVRPREEDMEDVELLVDDEYHHSENISHKFNLTLPRKVSSFCLNFRQILEQENYFALNI